MGIMPFIPWSAAAAWSSARLADGSAFRMRVPSPRARMTAERAGSACRVTSFETASSVDNGTCPSGAYPGGSNGGKEEGFHADRAPYRNGAYRDHLRDHDTQVRKQQGE